MAWVTSFRVLWENIKTDISKLTDSLGSGDVLAIKAHSLCGKYTVFARAMTHKKVATLISENANTSLQGTV